MKNNYGVNQDELDLPMQPGSMTIGLPKWPLYLRFNLSLIKDLEFRDVLIVLFRRFIAKIKREEKKRG